MALGQLLLVCIVLLALGGGVVTYRRRRDRREAQAYVESIMEQFGFDEDDQNLDHAPVSPTRRKAKFEYTALNNAKDVNAIQMDEMTGQNVYYEVNAHNDGYSRT